MVFTLWRQKVMFLKVILFLIIIYKCNGYYPNAWYHQNPNYHNHRKVPQDVMVEVVNNLALKLLAIHNEHNDNNIAISPYGVLSVLVALAEGLRSEAMFEVRQAAEVPSDLSVMRIGLRDIHRHLKSYFIPDEGFLSGLTLSHENVTLRREYEDILKFYGFDINSFNGAIIYSDFPTTSKPDLTTTETSTPIVRADKEGNDDTTTMSTNTETSTLAVTTSTTTEPSTIVTTMVPSTTQEVQSTKIDESTERPTTEQPVTDVFTTMMSTVTDVVTTIMSTTKSIETTVAISTTETAVGIITTPDAGTTSASTATVVITTLNPSSDGNTITTLGPDTFTITNPVTLDVTSPSTIQSVESTTLGASTVEGTTASPLVETLETSTPVFTTSADGIELTENNSEAATTNANYDETTFLPDYDAGTTNRNVDGTNEIARRSTRSAVDYIIARYYDDHSITQRPYDYQNDFQFLINGNYRESNVSYMTYDTVLPFYYNYHLRAAALRFPLDSTKYYLLLLLPDDHGGIDDLICSMRLSTSLRFIIDNLRYTHVNAKIPSFMMKGYVMLTTTFQKMGIHKIFEPRQADFSPMTNDRDIYVTNIEQAITVNIRNYVDPNKMKNYQQMHRNPVPFKADHPFVYFVMDSKLHVALMAGKVVNPLNSRIS